MTEGNRRSSSSGTAWGLFPQLTCQVRTDPLLFRGFGRGVQQSRELEGLIWEGVAFFVCDVPGALLSEVEDRNVTDSSKWVHAGRDQGLGGCVAEIHHKELFSGSWIFMFVLVHKKSCLCTYVYNFFRSILSWIFQTRKSREKPKIFIGFSMKIKKNKIFEKSKIEKIVIFRKNQWKFSNFRFFEFFEKTDFLNFSLKIQWNFWFFAGFSGLKDSTSNRPKKIVDIRTQTAFFMN